MAETTRKALYAGSFDPFTNGHLAILEAAAELFDEVTIVIATNPDKKGRFSALERKEMIQKAVQDKAFPIPVNVVHLPGRYVAEWAEENGIRWMVRGVRGAADIDGERIIALMNATIAPSVQTIYIPSPGEVENVSSSLVMGLVGPIGWRQAVSKLVPSSVFKAIFREQAFKEFKSLFLRRFKGQNDEAVFDLSVKCFLALEAAYGEAHRKYHTFDHIFDVLEELERAGVTHPDIHLAAWFHDFINGDGEGDDEFRSALKMRELFGDRWMHVVGFIADLVESTKKCGDNPFCRGSEDAQNLVDADMAILGQKPHVYQRYAGLIRQEFARYEDEVYARGRRLFLQGVLAQERIYFTTYFRERYEAQARENLKWELACIATALGEPNE